MNKKTYMGTQSARDEIDERRKALGEALNELLRSVGKRVELEAEYTQDDAWIDKVSNVCVGFQQVLEALLDGNKTLLSKTLAAAFSDLCYDFWFEARDLLSKEKKDSVVGSVVSNNVGHC